MDQGTEDKWEPELRLVWSADRSRVVNSEWLHWTEMLPKGVSVEKESSSRKRGLTKRQRVGKRENTGVKKWERGRDRDGGC
jgi:hypothetical protein